MSTNVAKTLVWKHGNDVKLWRHKQRTPNTNDHHMTLNQSPPIIFCVRHCLHPTYSIQWRIYASFRTLCIWTYDAYMRHSATKALAYLAKWGSHVSFFQSNRDNSASTVGFLALTWECRSVHMRVVPASDRKQLPKQTHYEQLLIRRNQ